MSSADPVTSVELEPGDVLDSTWAGRSALRGVLHVGGYGGGMLLALISAPLLIRHLNQVGYGRYITALSIATIAASLTEGGVNTIAVREFASGARTDRDLAMANMLSIRLLLSGLGMVGAVAFAAAAGYGEAIVVDGGGQRGDDTPGRTGVVGSSSSEHDALGMGRHRRSTAQRSEHLFDRPPRARRCRHRSAVGGEYPGWACESLVDRRVGAPLGSVQSIPALRVIRSTAARDYSVCRGDRTQQRLLPRHRDRDVTDSNWASDRLLLDFISCRRDSDRPAAAGHRRGVPNRDARRTRRSRAVYLRHPPDVRASCARRRVGCARDRAVAPFVVRVLGGRAAAPAAAVLRIQGPAVAGTFVAVACGFPLLSMRRYGALLMANGLGLVVTLAVALSLGPALAARGARDPPRWRPS